MRLTGVVLLLGLAVGARVEGQEVTPNRNVVEFENGGIELVRLYLVDRGSMWLLGRADPGRVTLLTLPAGFTGRQGGQILLVAVPLGAPGGREARLGAVLETVHRLGDDPGVQDDLEGEGREVYVPRVDESVE